MVVRVCIEMTINVLKTFFVGTFISGVYLMSVFGISLQLSAYVFICLVLYIFQNICRVKI